MVGSLDKTTQTMLSCVRVGVSKGGRGTRYMEIHDLNDDLNNFIQVSGSYLRPKYPPICFSDTKMPL
jgi:hypothetical protein